MKLLEENVVVREGEHWVTILIILTKWNIRQTKKIKFKDEVDKIDKSQAWTHNVRRRNTAREVRSQQWFYFTFVH